MSRVADRFQFPFANLSLLSIFVVSVNRKFMTHGMNLLEMKSYGFLISPKIKGQAFEIVVHVD